MYIGKKVAFNLFASLSLAVVAIFAIWWFNPSHLPHNFHGNLRIFDVLAFLLLSYILWHPIVMEILAWAVGSHIKETEYYEPPPGLKVAFITTFVPESESIELLYQALPAMVAADYPHDTWLLDEGNDPQVRAFCATIGIKHFSRAGNMYLNTPQGKYARKTKGGNHNSWYDSFGNNYDIVAQIDTDFVPSSSFLTKTLGQFRDPKVAFVGTPQIYGNTKDSFIARGAAQQTFNFYGPILRGMHAMDTTMLIGANHVIRVEALKSVGHYSAHITEDLLTGMKLHAGGWKSVYIDEPLAIGEGPATWHAYFNQQMRWAYGCMDVLLKHSPKLLPRMSLRRRLYYLWIQQHYFSGIAMIASLAGLGLYFFFDFNTSQIPIGTFLKLYGLVLAVCAIMTWQLQKYNVRPEEERGPMLAGRVLSIACWPVFFLAFVGVIRGKRLVYKVTRKGHKEVEDPNRVSFRVFRAHLLIGFYCVVCILVSLIEHRHSAIMLAWASITGLLMFSMPFALRIYGFLATANQWLTAFMEQLARRYELFEPNEKYKYLKEQHPYLVGFSLFSFALATISETFFLAGHYSTWALWPLYGYVPVFLAAVHYLSIAARDNLQTMGIGSRYNQAGFVYNIYKGTPPAEQSAPIKSVSISTQPPAAANLSPFERLLAEAEARMALPPSLQP